MNKLDHAFKNFGQWIDKIIMQFILLPSIVLGLIVTVAMVGFLIIHVSQFLLS